MSNVGVAFLNTALAGLATMLGAVIVFFTGSDNKKFLSSALGFSAGVMIYISFMEKALEKVGSKSAIAIGVHNFPEGMVTFMTTLLDPAVGVSIAIAIAMHNIPEGIGVAAPIYFATGGKKKALWLTFLSGVSEPLGAILAYLVLRPFLTTTLFGIVFAAISGIMVLISFDELLPASRAYGETHLSLVGVIFGMLVMGVSLIIL